MPLPLCLLKNNGRSTQCHPLPGLLLLRLGTGCMAYPFSISSKKAYIESPVLPPPIGLDETRRLRVCVPVTQSTRQAAGRVSEDSASKLFEAVGFKSPSNSESPKFLTDKGLGQRRWSGTLEGEGLISRWKLGLPGARSHWRPPAHC